MVYGPWSIVVVRALLWVLAAGLVAVVLLTQSRGAWLALGFAMLLFLFLASQRWWQRALVLAGAGVILIVGAIAAPWWAPGLLRLDVTGSPATRLEVWNRSLAMIRDTPFTGVGLGTFPLILDAFYPSFLGGPDARIPHAHNLPLQVAVDLGVPGALAFVGLLGAGLASTGQAVRQQTRRTFGWCGGLGLVTALTVVAAHGLVDATLWVARSMPLLWLLLGLAASWRELNRC